MKKKEAVEGRVLSIASQPFYTSRCGYRLCARAYLNGDGSGKGTHISLYFVVMRGEFDSLLLWPFKQKVTLMLLDQSGKKNHVVEVFRADPNSSSFKRPDGEMNIASGCPRFVPHAVLENTKNTYIRDDTLFLKVVVDLTDLEELWKACPINVTVVTVWNCFRGEHQPCNSELPPVKLRECFVALDYRTDNELPKHQPFLFYHFFPDCIFKAARSPVWWQTCIQSRLAQSRLGGMLSSHHQTGIWRGNSSSKCPGAQAGLWAPLPHTEVKPCPNVQVHFICLQWKHFNISKFESMCLYPSLSLIFEAGRMASVMQGKHLPSILHLFYLF